MIKPLEQFRSRLRMRHLQLLFVLSEEGSLRKTANIMALTQPAVTKALHELESLVGEALFIRTHKGLVANTLGEAAIRYAQLVFADMSGLHEEMTALQSGNLGTLRIGSMGSLVGGLLPRTLAQLTQRHPKLNITVVIDTSDVLLQALSLDQLDLVIARITDGWPTEDLNFEAFDEEVIQIVARTGHPQQHNSDVTLETLARYPWIVQSQPAPLREIYQQIFRQSQVQAPASPLETASTMLTVSLLQQTDMLALMPLSLVEYYSELGVLAPLPITVAARLMPFGLISRKGRVPTAAMEVVKAELRVQAGLEGTGGVTGD
ncbi:MULTISPECIES: LysR family transcriptional regulator [unclassified Pseudomonas]|uniref:LysR family transcriptional regulator n=1 Tax=unclassified Pseudomonas TaxID=196821 RepID=UPI001C5B6221|nr:MULTISPECIES: LysR family transcriptional regulator [unclassified Pseudomonas]MBW3506996.1 LysR family transcriptional regulator [Pseudomonas sp. NKUCC02_KPG]MEC4239424.1 LysR family transcriptional regulator [Pseudomonas sp. DSV-1]